MKNISSSERDGYLYSISSYGRDIGYLAALHGLGQVKTPIDESRVPTIQDFRRNNDGLFYSLRTILENDLAEDIFADLKLFIIKGDKQTTHEIDECPIFSPIIEQVENNTHGTMFVPEYNYARHLISIYGHVANYLVNSALFNRPFIRMNSYSLAKLSGKTIAPGANEVGDPGILPLVEYIINGGGQFPDKCIKHTFNTFVEPFKSYKLKGEGSLIFEGQSKFLSAMFSGAFESFQFRDNP